MEDEEDRREAGQLSPLRPEEYRFQADQRDSKKKSAESDAREAAIMAQHGPAIRGRLQNFHDVNDDLLEASVQCAVSDLAGRPADYSQMSPDDVTRFLNRATDQAFRQQHEPNEREQESLESDRDRTQREGADQEIAPQHGAERQTNYYARLKSGSDQRDQNETGDKKDGPEKEIDDAHSVTTIQKTEDNGMDPGEPRPPKSNGRSGR